MLDELERLEKAATPGPWEWHRFFGGDNNPAADLLAGIHGHDQHSIIESAYFVLEHDGDNDANAAFIAAARNALPALLRLARADLTLRDLERQYVDSTDGMFDEFVKMRWGAAVEERNAALAALEAQP